MCKLYCHKCGKSIDKESNFCSNCAAKVENVKAADTKSANRSSKITWLLPTATFFIVLVVFGSFYFYEAMANSEVEALVQEGEAKALEGNLHSAKVVFNEALQIRPKHTTAAFNIEVVERGQRYQELLDEAASFGEKDQFDDGLLILDELELELAEEEGPFFERLKEQSEIQTASLTVASVNEADLEKKTTEELIGLLEKIKNFTSKEAKEMDQLLKEKLIFLAINQGENYLQKNQFTEAEIEFDRGLSYEPTNEKLLAYKETAKNERITFKQAEKKRLENATAMAAEEDNFNWTKAIKPLVLESSYDEDKGELHVWGEAKNVGTRPINEIDIHYMIFDEDGNELTNNRTSVSPYVLMPNKIGHFEETLLISETVGQVEMIDYYWAVK